MGRQGRRFLMLALAASCLLITACSKKVDKSQISIDEKGQVTSVLIEEFDSEEYSFDDLKTMTGSEVDSYNKKKGDKIKIKQLKNDEKAAKVYLTMTYASLKDYRAFNQRTLYQGKVAKAKEKFDFVGSFVDAKGKKVEGKEAAARSEKDMVIITNEPTGIEVDGKILFVSENAVIESPHLARVAADRDQDLEEAKTLIDGYAYIIYKTN